MHNRSVESVYVCIYIYIYICLHVYTHIHIHISIHIHLHIRIYIYIYIYIDPSHNNTSSGARTVRVKQRLQLGVLIPPFAAGGWCFWVFIPWLRSLNGLLNVINLNRAVSQKVRKTESYCVLKKKNPTVNHCEWERITWYSYVHKLFKFFIDIHVQFPKCPNPWSFPCIESTERSWWIFSTSGGFKSSRIQLKINNELMTFNQISVIFLSKIYWVKFPELITFSFYHIFWSSISSMIWIRGVLWIFQAFSSAQRRPPAGPTKSLTYRWSRCSPPSTPSGPRDSAALP